MCGCRPAPPIARPEVEEQMDLLKRWRACFREAAEFVLLLLVLNTVCIAGPVRAPAQQKVSTG